MKIRLAAALFASASLLVCAPSIASSVPMSVSNQSNVSPGASMAIDRLGVPTDTSNNSTSGAFSAAGASTGIAIRGTYNFSLWGTFVATCEVDRSFDLGVTWIGLTALGTALTWSGPATEVLSEPEAGVYYRVNCTSWTSGSVNYRLSQ